MKIQSKKSILDSILSSKNGLIFSYLGTLMITASIGFNTGVRFGEYPTVIATHPSFVQWGIGLIGLGFIIQYLDNFNLYSKIIFIVAFVVPLFVVSLVKHLL